MTARLLRLNSRRGWRSVCSVLGSAVSSGPNMAAANERVTAQSVACRNGNLKTYLILLRASSKIRLARAGLYTPQEQKRAM